MSLERIFPILNQMEAEGVIGRYAIGGAVGAIFWLEPFQTKDLDVFVSLPATPGGTLLTLSPIYDYLLGLGYVEEALATAVDRDVNGTITRVFTAEHLTAICLQVGRSRDRDRIERFLEAGVLDSEKLASILTRHGLLEKWCKFQENDSQP